MKKERSTLSKKDRETHENYLKSDLFKQYDNDYEDPYPPSKGTEQLWDEFTQQILSKLKKPK